jgi:hypothetical protein
MQKIITLAILCVATSMCLYISSSMPLNFVDNNKSIIFEIPISQKALNFESQKPKSIEIISQEISEKTVEVVYYIKQTQDGLFTCSGLLRENFKIDTVSHCLDFRKSKNEKLVSDTITRSQILTINKYTINSNQNLELSIATVDKGLVLATINEGCIDKECNYYGIKSYKSLGQGNSGSPVFGADTNLVGHLSYLQTDNSYLCDTIKYTSTIWKPTNQKRDCGYNLILTTTKEFKNNLIYEKKL